MIFPRRTAARKGSAAGFAIALIRLAGLAALAAGCGSDEADREYLAMLRGSESGMSPEERLAHLDRAISLAPGRAHYYETRAVCWIDLRQFDRARRDLDRDIELLPRPYAYYLRGLAMCQAGGIAQSLADFDTAIAGQPDNTQFYRGRSLARAATGNRVGALEDAEHLVRTAPQWGESYYARGVALALLDRDAEAVADFDRAAGIRPELVFVVEARERSLERLGDTARARADREALPGLRVRNDGCALCFDPFRY